MNLASVAVLIGTVQTLIWGATADWCSQPGASSFYPHPETCLQFVQCDHGRDVIRQCGAKTAFDPSLNICNHITSRLCRSDFSLAYDITQFLNPNQVNNNNNQQPTFPQQPNPPVAPNPPVDPWGPGFNGCPNDMPFGRYGDFRDRQVFYECRMGRVTRFVCDDNLLFNWCTINCDLPQNADCPSHLFQ